MQPIKHIKSQNKPLNSPAKLSQAQLFEHVKDSTERNRQFFFIWITFALYVIVTTVATTDLQLLLPNSTVTLPALGIQLPLIGFFLVTPWLVLILHFNLLQNLDSHANKLAEWANTYPNQIPPRSALPAFLFDFAMLEQGGSLPKITQTAAQMVFYAMGPIIIGVLLCRFSDYQDWSYTASQLLAFVVSLYMVVVFIRALTRKHRINTSVALFSYVFAYVPVIGMVALQAFLAGWLALKDEEPPFLVNLKHEFLLPRIKIPPRTEVVNLPADLSSRMALDGEKEVEVWLNKYGVGADLEARKLKYAQLKRLDLRSANLKGAQLQNSDLSATKLNGANLIDTNFINANLTFAQLRGAVLIGTKLQGADLNWAGLHGASLTNIAFDKNTNFMQSFTNKNTNIYVKPSLDFTADLKATQDLREKLRDENHLRLPSILYNQLSVVPQAANPNDSNELGLPPTAIFFPAKEN